MNSASSIKFNEGRQEEWARRVFRSSLFAAAAFVIALVVGCGSGTTVSTKTTTTTTTPTINTALWIANGTNVVEYLPSQLVSTSGDTTPHLVNNSGAFGAPQGVVFDAAGDLWVIDGGTVAAGGTVKPALYEFTPTQLAALGTMNAPEPAVTVNSSQFTFPQQAVFDQAGDLWVSDNGSNAVFVFSPGQLAAGGGDVKPDVTIMSNPAFNGPLGIAFDPFGDLFIANNGSTTIFAFKAANLPMTPETVTLKPDVILSDDGKGSIQAPWALIFDSLGNLYSSNANAPNTIVKFAQNSLLTTGNPVPAVTISPANVGNNTTLAAPNGIAFDNLGDLAAISSATPFGVPFYSHGQLTTGGAINPSVFLVGNATTLNAPAGCTFGPVVN